MATRTGKLSPAEQWGVLLGPIVVIFGLTWILGRRQGQGTKGLGDCGCGCNGRPGGCGGNTRGFGSVHTLDNWSAGESYQPFGPALAARQTMIPPLAGLSGLGDPPTQVLNWGRRGVPGVYPSNSTHGDSPFLF